MCISWINPMDFDNSNACKKRKHPINWMLFLFHSFILLLQNNKLGSTVHFVFFRGAFYPIGTSVDQFGFPKSFPFQSVFGYTLGNHIGHG